nr:autotransporter outer membrane beta-barrel domain-containing protein [Aureimonas altamirensis]
MFQLRRFRQMVLASSCLVLISGHYALAQSLVVDSPPDYSVGVGGESYDDVEIGPNNVGTVIVGPGGSLTSAGPIVIGRNANSSGTLVIGAPAGSAPVAPGVVNAPTINFGAGSALLVFNHDDPAYDFGAGLVGGPNALVRLESGRTILSGDSSAFNGVVETVANVYDKVIQVDGILGGTLNIAPGSALEGIGTVQNVAVAGSIRPGGNGAFGTLTINGDYVGQDNWVEMDTVLGDDASVTDRLIIRGNSSGDSTLIVNDRSGIGAPTNEGILLIQVDGASNANFVLDGYYTDQNNRSAIIAGAYSYSLYKGSVSDPTNGNWYLRSIAKDAPADPTDPTDPTDPSTPTGPTDPTDPTAPGSPADPDGPGFPTGPIGSDPAADPLYQPGVPLYEAYPSLLLDMNRLPTLRQRVGNRIWSGTADPKPFHKGALTNTPPQDLVDGRAVWGRIEGRGFDITPDRSASGWQSDGSLWRIQAGVDFPVYEAAGGDVLVGGVWLHHGRGSADVDSFAGSGTIDTTGSGVGASLTYYAQNGLYVDGQVQGTWYQTDIWSDTLNMVEADGNDGFGWSASVEVGRSFDIAYEWSVTPQAQLIYSSVDFDDFTDATGAGVRLLRGDSLVGRLGISLDHETTWESASGDTRRLQTYGLVDVRQEFLDGTRIEVGGIPLDSSTGDTWLGGALGATYNWSDDAWSVYGQVGVASDLGDFGDSIEVSGTAGLRVRF